MRKMLLLVVSVFLVLFLGGLSISWFTQARLMKKQVADAITQVNGGLPYFSYKEISASGFPWNVNISIVNPRFTGRVDTFLKHYLSGNDEEKMKTIFPLMRAWDEDAMLNGRIIIGVNALSDRYTVTLEGKWRNTTMIDNNLLTFDGIGTGDSGCVLKLARKENFFTTMWNVATLKDEPRDLAEDLRSLECSNDSFTITENGFNEALYSNGPQRLSLTQDLSEKNRKVHFALKSTNVEVTPKGNGFLLFYMQAFNGSEIIPPRVSEAGKQNAEIDLTYDGPANLTDLTTEAIDISLNKLHLQSNIGTVDGHLKYAVKPSGDDRSVIFNTNLVTVPNKGYDNYITNRFHDIAHSFYTNSDERLAKERAKLNKYTEEEAFELVKPVIPKLESLGRIVQNVVADYQGKNDLSSGNFNLDDFEIGTDPYGLSAKGTVRMVEKQLPEPHFKITCRNCVQMIDDSTSYARRVIETYNYFESQDLAPIFIDPVQIGHFKSFLSDLAAPAEGTVGPDLTYAIIGDGTPNITINEKPMDQVLSLYTKYFPPAPSKPLPSMQPTPGELTTKRKK